MEQDWLNLESIDFEVKRYAWKCYLFGTSGEDAMVWLVSKPPNLFWRKMQRLILGNRWERIEKS